MQLVAYDFVGVLFFLTYFVQMQAVPPAFFGYIKLKRFYRYQFIKKHKSYI